MSLIFNIIFLLVSFVLLYFFFRPNKGWWYYLKEKSIAREKIILEDILKSLYRAKEEGEHRNTKAIVKQLPFSEQQIFNVLKEMEVRKLILFKESEIELSSEGKEYALRIIRAHRLWEHYLAEKTGYHKKDWHKLAEKAEHQLTEENLEALSKELKRPLFDPHGSPIPYSTDDINEIKGSPLSSFPVGTIGRIVHIQDEPEAIYSKILAEDIHIGSQVELKRKENQNIEFLSDGKKHILPHIIANALTVAPLEEEEIAEKVERLSTLMQKEKAIILGISRECRGENRRRLLDLGFVKGTPIKISSVSPLGDPTAYDIRDTLIALRKEQAQFILIEKGGSYE